MIFPSRTPAAALVCFVGAAAPIFAQAPAADPLDVQALKRGEEAINQQKYPEAVQAFEGLIQQFPQSAVIAQAFFRLGYAEYLLGDYDKAVENFKKASAANAAPPEIVELALSLTPQVLAAKASKLKADDPARDAALNDAIKQFDVFLQKFPQSEEGEAANMGKALASFQLKRYNDAAQALRANLQKYPQSETIQDSQFTLALVLGSDGASALSKATAPDPAAMSKIEEGEKLLRDIVAKRINLALVNDAQFQLGEMLNARGSFTDAKQKEQREGFFKRALEAYRGVFTKEQVIAAQKQRIENISQRRVEAGKQKNVQLLTRLQRVQEKEQEKLATFEGRGDQTVTAKIKSGQIFFQLGKYDETRVLLTFVEPFAGDPEDKKLTQYFITMTYALQGAMAKAEERYKAFQTTYKGDPIAENLQLVMAAGFLSKDPKIFNAEKAIAYCKEGLEIYPKGRFAADLLNIQANALIGQKRYDEAQALLKRFIESDPSKDLAAEAQFNLAIIHKDTGKLEESLKTFREIREKYSGTKQAEQAAYWVGELSLAGDPKTAITELKSFIGKFRESDLLPQATFALARAQAAAGQTNDALLTFADLPKKYPKSEPAPFSFFERAKIAANRQKYDECLAIMKEFIAAYPENPALFQAYDFMAQILTSQQKGMEAIGVYEDFVKQHPDHLSTADALLKLSSLWKGYADGQGPVLAQDAAKRAEWTKGIESSIAAAEHIVTKFPDSPMVALALTSLLEAQKSRLPAKLISDADISAYFNDLAAKAAAKPALQNKIQFTLASFVSKKDKEKANQMMAGAYKPDQKYAPEDIDRYGQGLLQEKKYDEALKVYEKLASDYPLPPGSDSKRAPRDIQEAQAIALAGQGEALQGKGEKDAGGRKFKELEDHYAWSPKMLEVNYGLAIALHEKKEDDGALKRLLEVIKAQKAPAELRANSMLLLGRIHEENKRFDQAIDNYIKIATYYQGVPDAAAEGLWRGAQLLEKQGSGEIPRPTPPPKATGGAPAKK